jgi:hypothetical protein
MNLKSVYLHIAALIGIACAIFGTNCNSGTNPPPPVAGPLELLFPKGGSGQSFNVGDTVMIKWTIHDKSQVGSVAIKYSLSVDSNWSVNDIGDKSFSYPDTSYLWAITATYTSNQFALKIYEYNNHTPCDSSARFVIRQ